MSTPYCEQSDVYRFVPAEMLKAPGKLVSSTNTTTNTLTLSGHGLKTDQPVLFRAESGGSLPSPLVAGTTYYAIVLTPDTFQVATAPAGSAIDLSGTPSNVVLVVPFLWDEWILEESAMVEQSVPAHTLPLLNPDNSIPLPIKRYTAVLVALRALAHVGAQTPLLDRLLDERTEMGKAAAAWARGVPLRGEQRPPAANAAISRSGARVDPRHWDRGTGRLP